MTSQSLKKHQITLPNIYRLNSPRFRWFAAIILTLGMNSFAAADQPFTPAKTLTAQSDTFTQAWEDLKSRSAEKRWESISRERKRELKKRARKERKEQRKSHTNSSEVEFVPEFRQIPDDIPKAPGVPELKNDLPQKSASSNKTTTQNSNIPVTQVVSPTKSFKTIGLEKKQAVTNSSDDDLKINNTVPLNSNNFFKPIVPLLPKTVPVFTETSTSQPKLPPIQKSYDNAAASPQSDDLVLSTEDLEDEVPHLLKKISGIKPFFAYEPDPEIAEKEPCRNLCPRPDGKPCKVSESNEETILACPKEFQLSREPYAGRNFSESIYTWEASNLNYRPLYFEDPNLERYGNSRKDLIQPFVSMGRFTGQLLALPYQMSIDPIRKPIYPLGYYRPGVYTPKRINGIPWNTKAAITQGLTATGLAFLLP